MPVKLKIKASSKSSTKIIWISFDLGLTGNYSALYKWLDLHDAQECGSNLAVIRYISLKGGHVAALKKEIEKLRLSSNDRIYILWLDHATKKMKGEFLHGKRKPAPWAGYYMGRNQSVDSGE